MPVMWWALSPAAPKKVAKGAKGRLQGGVREFGANKTKSAATRATETSTAVGSLGQATAGNGPVHG